MPRMILVDSSPGRPLLGLLLLAASWPMDEGIWWMGVDGTIFAGP